MIKLHNKTNSYPLKEKPLRISFTRDGIVILNSSLVSKMELVKGDKVEIAEEDADGSWYIFKSNSVNAFKLRHGGKGCLSFRSVILRNKLIATTPLLYADQINSIRYLVAKDSIKIDGVNMYQIILNSVKQFNNIKIK